MLAEGENYHVYNRGAHKQAIFTSAEDYERFQILLYLLNGKFSILMRDILASYKGKPLRNIFIEEPSDRSLVDILGYALMPNHFHLVLRQKVDDGVSRFMQKLCTAYSMYYNEKYDHSGVLFQGRYKRKHIDDESYFRYIFSYIHLNPLELLQKDWEKKGIKNPVRARAFLAKYHFSSFPDYTGDPRPENSILADRDIPDFLKDQNDLEEMLKWEAQSAEARPLQKLGITS